jgi:CxxC motif-containing protein
MPTLTCIECPNGCQIQWERKDGVLSLQGNRCPRGRAYGEAELTHPMRSLTTTVRTVFSDYPVVSVRTDGQIPKELVSCAVQALSAILVKDRLPIGAVVVNNLLDTGVSVLCTTDMTMY